MVDVRRSFELYRRLVGAQVRSRLEYRLSFVFEMLASFGITFIDFIVVLVLFSHITALGGWSLWEVAFLYGLAGISFAIADLFIGHIEDTHLLIRSGQFDVVLLRPVSSLLQMIASDLPLRRLGKLAQATIVFVLALTHLNVHWTIGRAVVLVASIASGAVIFGSVWVLGACLTFWTVGSGEVGNAFTYGGNMFASYPLDIFNQWLRRFLAFVIPLGFVAYMPGVYVLGKHDALQPSRRPARRRTARRGRDRDRGGVRVAVLRPPLPRDGLVSGAPEPGALDNRVITVTDLEKTFTVWQKRGALRRERTQVTAVAGVSFTVNRGEMLGYVGPNGAGKSTTIKMLTGVLVPSAGVARVNGLIPAQQRVQLARRIGVVFGQRSLLWWDLPLAESFRLLRHIYDVDTAAHGERLAECRELLDLDEFITTPVRQLSLGQRMRGELTAALLHGPEILFLDEPTIGLDVVSKARVRTFLADLNSRRGTTVLLTTHDLADIERLCSRLLIIDHGRVIYDGALETLRDRYGTSRMLVVDFTDVIPPVELAPGGGGQGRRAPSVAPLPARRPHRLRPDRADGRALFGARPHDRGTRGRGHRAQHLHGRDRARRLGRLARFLTERGRRPARVVAVVVEEVLDHVLDRCLRAAATPPSALRPSPRWSRS